MAPDTDIDTTLRATIAAVEGRVREPVGRSLHIHQLDGARTEAMVYLESTGARVEWVHGKGDCAVTGAGASILALLRGHPGPAEFEADGSLILYGDRDLVDRAPAIFAAAPPG